MVDSMKNVRIILHKDPKNRWRWTAKAGNNKIVGSSEQGHISKWYATRKALKQFPNATVVENSTTPTGGQNG
jgi:uncharacterized protein YegP (UPF0339 family)